MEKYRLSLGYGLFLFSVLLLSGCSSLSNPFSNTSNPSSLDAQNLPVPTNIMAVPTDPNTQTPNQPGNQPSNPGHYNQPPGGTVQQSCFSCYPQYVQIPTFTLQPVYPAYYYATHYYYYQNQHPLPLYHPHHH